MITRLVRGGAQENTLHTVRLANRRRYVAELLAGPPEGPEGSLEDQAEEQGVPVQRIAHLVRAPAPRRDVLAYRDLLMRFRRERYDIVHTHTSKAGILGRADAARAGVPHLVHTPHGNVFHGYFNPVLTGAFVRAERWAAGFTDRIIELTPGGIDEHLAQGIGARDQFRVVFSGIDLAPYEDARAARAATRAALGLPGDAFVVGGVGRLEPVKGFIHLVDAARHLLETGADLYFVQAGVGSQAPLLKEAARPLGPRFHWLGHRDDVPNLMAAFDVLVVPSENEGMGRVVLEAGAAGVACVAARTGGLPDVIDEGRTGLLVPPREPSAIAAALRRLLDDRAYCQALGAAAREKVVPHYGLTRMVRAIEELYEELLDG